MKFIISSALTVFIALSGTACSTIATIAKPPTLEAYSQEYFPVGAGHELYIEQAGNPNGIPILIFHGGPGAGTNKKVKRFFDPGDYRIITFDQRGAGRSHFSSSGDPLGFMADNNLPALVSDIEKIREHLKIEKWLLFGGSWGSTLALAYAEQNTEHVLGILIWGIYLGKKAESPWLNADIQKQKFPKRWAAFSQGFTPSEMLNPAAAYAKKLTDPKVPEIEKLEWARRWSSHEVGVSHTIPVDDIEEFSIPTEKAEREGFLRGAIIETTYLANESFQTPANDILAHASQLAKLPVMIVQGDADFICPIEGAATALHEALPSAQFIRVPMGGHSPAGPRMELAIRAALENLETQTK